MAAISAILSVIFFSQARALRFDPPALADSFPELSAVSLLQVGTELTPDETTFDQAETKHVTAVAHEAAVGTPRDGGGGGVGEPKDGPVDPVAPLSPVRAAADAAGGGGDGAGEPKDAAKLKPKDLSIDPVSAAISTAVSVVALGVAMWIESSTSEGETHSAASKLVAEFVGTFMLIFSVGCNVIVGDATWGVVSIACTLMVMIYALGGISGGNFNPAVSVTLGLAGKMPWSRVCTYSLTQVAAGIIAANAYGLMLDETFPLAPKDGHTILQAGLAELLYTFMLTFCVLNTACSKKHAGNEQFYGLAIGFCVVAGGYGAGAISGGCFNPAVALAIDTSSARLGFGQSFAYVLFELLGSALAAGLFRVCRPDDYDESAPTDPYPLMSRLVSEFLGTYMLVLTVGLNVLAQSKAAVFSIASSLMCMIFALGSCSGGHFNPAVTYAVFRRGGPVSASHSLFYVLVQLLGGVLAACTFIGLQNGKDVPLQPKVGFEMQAHVGEFVFTFLLAFVVLCVATVEKPLSNYFGLAIGSCVTAGGLAIGSLSGGCLNPAVSAGLGITTGKIATVLSYSGAQLLAGEFAAGVFKATHASELWKTAK